MAESPDREKARRAAERPKRRGANCRAELGRYVPVVDHGRCEGGSGTIDEEILERNPPGKPSGMLAALLDEREGR